jgi:hypothetical protein
MAGIDLQHRKLSHPAQRRLAWRGVDLPRPTLLAGLVAQRARQVATDTAELDTEAQPASPFKVMEEVATMRAQGRPSSSRLWLGMRRAEVALASAV